MTTLKDNLRKEMEKRGWNANMLSAKSGVPQPTIHRFLSGHHGEPRSVTIAKLAEGLNITESELRGFNTHKIEETPAHYADFLPVAIGNFKLQAGITGYAIEYAPQDSLPPIYFRKDWLQKQGYRHDKLIACQVHGHSMLPRLNDGDTVLINTADTAAKEGSVFAINYEGELLIKRLIRESGQWWLSSDNPDKALYPNKLCAGEYCLLIGRIVHHQSTVI